MSFTVVSGSRSHNPLHIYIYSVSVVSKGLLGTFSSFLVTSNLWDAQLEVFYHQFT